MRSLRAVGRQRRMEGVCACVWECVRVCVRMRVCSSKGLVSAP